MVSNIWRYESWNCVATLNEGDGMLLFERPLNQLLATYMIYLLDIVCVAV